jgi:hypothetical protein
MRRFLLSLAAAALLATFGKPPFAHAQTDNSYFVGAIAKTAVTALGAAPVATVNAATGASTINLVAGSTLTTGLTVGCSAYDLTLTGNVVFTASGFNAGTLQKISLVLRQDATGGRTITWPAAIKWSTGTAPTFVTTANTITVITLVSDDGGVTVIGAPGS